MCVGRSPPVAELHPESRQRECDGELQMFLPLARSDEASTKRIMLMDVSAVGRLGARFFLNPSLESTPPTGVSYWSVEDSAGERRTKEQGR